jgi:hypothetical protein
LLFLCLFSHSKIKEKCVAFNRFDCLGLSLHLVPRLVNNAFPEQFKSQVGLVCFVADVFAHVFAFLYELVLFSYVDDELISFELFDLSDVVVFMEEIL